MSVCVSPRPSALAALLLALPWLVGTAHAQTAGAKPGDEAAKYLNNSLYRITILDNYDKTLGATGVLIKAPNLVLTAPIYDFENNNYYDRERNPFNRFWVCEQALDIVQAEAKRKQIAEDKEQNKQEENRYADFRKANEQKSGKGGADKGGAKKEDAEKAKQAVLDLKVDCVEAKVKTVDTRRGLVLLEAVEKLEGGVPAFNATDPLVNSTVRAFGFPGAAEFAPRRATEKDRSRIRLVPTVTTGTVVKINTDEKEGQRIVHQAPVSSGAWGSPLVNNCDEVVGLNSLQRAERLVKVDAQSKNTGKGTGQVEVGIMSVPTSNLTGAIGTKELLTFAELNGIEVPVVNRVACTLSLASQFSLQQNMWTLFVGATALLLASAAMVVALRRPGPVRNTIIRMFPNRARSRYSATVQQGYGESHSETGSHGSSGYMSDKAATDAYAAKPAPAALRADPTNMMPAYAGGGAKLAPIAGGQPFTLDPARLVGSGLTFGRESDCDIVCDHSTVSKQHARITRTANGKLQIEDLGSANGTWRGRNRIQREAFSGGDIVRFGAIEYRVELSGNGASSTLLMPSVSWQLSGLDEGGRAVQWHLQPTTDGSGRQLETTWIVGRSSEGADLVLSDKRVSSQQAKIRFTPQRGLEICDLGSSNGTKVDGRKIADSFVAIADAQLIEFGGSKMSMSKR